MITILMRYVTNKQMTCDKQPQRVDWDVVIALLCSGIHSENLTKHESVCLDNQSGHWENIWYLTTIVLSLEWCLEKMN